MLYSSWQQLPPASQCTERYKSKSSEARRRLFPTWLVVSCSVTVEPLSPPALRPEVIHSNGRFHGVKPPAFPIEEEKPWHRAAALMFAAGAVTIKEVAHAFDVSEPTIRNLMRQEWFQEMVTRLMAEHGGKDIMALFQAEQYNSLVTLVEIRDNLNASNQVRRACAVDILDRAMGKPVQRVETSSIPHSADPIAESRRLEEENNRLLESMKTTSVAARAEDELETRA